MVKRPLFLLIIIFSLFTAVEAAAGINYSADLTTVSRAGTFTSKIYVRDDVQRMDMNSDGGKAITILRGDKKVVWMLMPQSKLYVEMPIDLKRELLPPFTSPDFKVEKKPIGSGTVDGHPAREYHVDITRKGKRESSGFIWEATDLNGLPVKFETEDKSITMTWKNIKIGGAASALFDIPPGYKKIEVSVPGMAGKGAGR